MNHHFNYYVPSAQMDLLREVSSASNLPVSELLRRFTDHCLTGSALDVVVPCCSGMVTASGKN